MPLPSSTRKKQTRTPRKAKQQSITSFFPTASPSSANPTVREGSTFKANNACNGSDLNGNTNVHTPDAKRGQPQTSKFTGTGSLSSLRRGMHTLGMQTSAPASPQDTLPDKLTTLDGQNRSGTSARLRSLTEPRIPSETIASPPRIDSLRRTLFLDDADDEPLLSGRPKRRRIVTEDSDEEISHNPSPPDATVPSRGTRLNRGTSPKTLVGNKECWDAQAESKKSHGDSCCQTKPLTEGREDELALSALERQEDSVTVSQLPLHLLKGSSKAREKLLEVVGASIQVGQEPGGWCEKHKWSVDIRDAKKRRPDHPDYDGSTLYVPPEVFEERRGSGKSPLTPFQRQFWKIKKEYYDVVIMFKKGKFYEMYDVDADIAHKKLGLNFTKGGRVDMRCCGIPEQSFEKHCLRLIDLGHKVGRVEQTETAIAADKRKASSSNTSAVCERSMVRILTKATAREEGLLQDHHARYALAITEKTKGDSPGVSSDQSTIVEYGPGCKGTASSVTIGVAYIDVASGSVTISQYEDDFRLSRTERLITCISPSQLVFDSGQCSKRLSNILSWTARSQRAAVDDFKTKGGLKLIDEIDLKQYLQHSTCEEGKGDLKRVLEYLKRYDVGRLAFGGLVAHLKYLIIDKEALSLANYNLFPDPDKSEMGSALNSTVQAALPLPSCNHLRMDAAALQNLEILLSNMGSERGSLLSFVDRATTPSGRRLIRKWVEEPLVSSSEIEDRLRAVEDIHAIEDLDGGSSLQKIIRLLRTKKDVERALPRLHQLAVVVDGAVMFDDTSKRKVKDFVQVLLSLQSNVSALETLAEVKEQIDPKSERLSWLCTPGCAVPADILDKLQESVGSLDIKIAERDGELIVSRGALESYDCARDLVDQLEIGLKKELSNWAKRLGDPSIQFYHRGKEPYQLEVKRGTLRDGLPEEFELVSESKTTQRFYTSGIRKLVRDKVEADEDLERESGSLMRNIVRKFDMEFTTWSALVQACSEVDALIGLARASRDNGSGQMVRPTILSNESPNAAFRARGLRHLILAQSADTFVANDVSLGEGGDTDIMILTGPNAGGKSTLARQVGLAVVLAQMGCFVPAAKLTLRPFEELFVRMGASDELARGRSTFMVEMEEVGHILNHATSKSLIIADEVGRGTSTHDGHAIACATLNAFSQTNKALTIFSTHYTRLADDMKASRASHRYLSADRGLRIDEYEMAAVVDEASKKITFLYKLRPGASGHSRGIYCARIAGIKDSVAEEAETASRLMFHNLQDNDLMNRLSSLVKALELPFTARNYLTSS